MFGVTSSKHYPITNPTTQPPVMFHTLTSSSDHTNEDIEVKSLKVSGVPYWDIISEGTPQIWTAKNTLTFKSKPIYVTSKAGVPFNNILDDTTGTLISGTIDMNKGGKIDIQVNGETIYGYEKINQNGTKEAGNRGGFYPDTEGNTGIGSLNIIETVRVLGVTLLGDWVWQWKLEGYRFPNFNSITFSLGLMPNSLTCQLG